MSRALAALTSALAVLILAPIVAPAQGLVTIVRQALLRGNGAPIHTLDNAFYKAYSPASLTLSRKDNTLAKIKDRMK